MLPVKFNRKEPKPKSSCFLSGKGGVIKWLQNHFGSQLIDVQILNYKIFLYFFSPSGFFRRYILSVETSYTTRD
jgi:hypothetical protein